MSCEKVSYPTKAIAERTKDIIKKKRRRKGLRVYYCVFCGKYHHTSWGEELNVMKKEKPRVKRWDRNLM